LPTKHISVRDSLLGAGASILAHLDSPQTATALWERVRVLPEIATYQRFVMVLDLLYALQAVEFADGLIARGKR